MLYVIQAEDNLYKIGISVNPLRRLKQLQTGNGQKLKILKTYDVKNERVTEKRVHAMLWQNQSILGKTEWFKLSHECLDWLLQFLETC